MTVVWPLCPNEAIHGVGFVRRFNATERVVDILRSIGDELESLLVKVS
jgi:hypothetical protein